MSVSCGGLEPKVAVGREMEVKCSGEANKEEGRADYNVESVKSGGDEECCSVDSVSDGEGGVLVFVKL